VPFERRKILNQADQVAEQTDQAAKHFQSLDVKELASRAIVLVASLEISPPDDSLNC